MPRLTKSLPKYRKHKRSGRAIVTIGGKDHYLGPYGTKASELEYDRIVAEWLAAGRTLAPSDDSPGLTVTELCARYGDSPRGITGSAEKARPNSTTFAMPCARSENCTARARLQTLARSLSKLFGLG